MPWYRQRSWWRRGKSFFGSQPCSLHSSAPALVWGRGARGLAAHRGGGPRPPQRDLDAGAEPRGQVVREPRDGGLAILALGFAEDRDLFHPADGADLDAEFSDHGMPPYQ